MCFIKIRDGEGDLPLIADYDIPVWKVLIGGRYSVHNSFVYDIHKLYETELGYTTIDDINNGDFIGFPADKIAYEYLRNQGFDRRDIKTLENFLIISQGFHSFYNFERALNYLNGNNDEDFRLVEFIIPKGSEYYKGGTGLSVSNKIIMKNH